MLEHALIATHSIKHLNDIACKWLRTTECSHSLALPLSASVPPFGLSLFLRHHTYGCLCSFSVCPLSFSLLFPTLLASLPSISTSNSTFARCLSTFTLPVWLRPFYTLPSPLYLFNYASFCLFAVFLVFLLFWFLVFVIFGQIKRKICQLIRLRLLDGFAVNMICFCGCTSSKVQQPSLYVCVCVRVYVSVCVCVLTAQFPVIRVNQLLSLGCKSKLAHQQRRQQRRQRQQLLVLC